MKRHSRLLIWLICGAILSGGATLAMVVLRRAGAPPSAVSGNLSVIKGQSPFGLPGLPGAVVSAEPGGFTTRTRRNGNFTLKLPPGVYQVSFSKEGYVSRRERVQVLASTPTLLFPVLFPEPTGAPTADLMRSVMSPGLRAIAYNTGIYLDASFSRNVSPDGIRWEIRDEAGRVLQDPHRVPAQSLQLEPSPIPGSSPLVFTFTPPAPGRYTARIYLKNRFSGGREVFADFVVEADNRGPEPLPMVIAGPNPPGVNPDGRLKEGSGLRTVVAGEKVFLAAWALDKNYPSPELYNPDGRQPDAYGKNFLPPQSRFTWRWRLFELHDKNRRTEVSGLLRSDGPGSPESSAYPWFLAERPGRYLAALWAEDHDTFGSRQSNPGTIEITVLPGEGAAVPERTCRRSGCHSGVEPVGKAGGKMTCQTCHGPGQPHVAAKEKADRALSIAVSFEAAQCGRCHKEFAEWEKSRHSDGYAFGHQEIAKPLLLNCTKCHYPRGFSDATGTVRRKRVDFGKVEFKKSLFPGGPSYFDFDRLPPAVGEGVSCQACHDPHLIGERNRTGLRLPKAELCGSCHESKWQNAILEGTAGRIGSAYEYPQGRYEAPNPHDTQEKCLLCHMNNPTSRADARGVRALGGHTLRMRDAGSDGRLGGFGPSPDDAKRMRDDYGADDILNLAPCRRCHNGINTFDLRGRQREIYELWTALGGRLAALNNGRLPGYKPGDKCATCHRGGTLPFDDDPGLVLDNAYTNYKLVGNDRSWGVHNYRYTRQLLEDSLKALDALPKTN